MSSPLSFLPVPVDQPIPQKEMPPAMTLYVLLQEALTAEGAHHKQWWLWRIGEMLGYDLEHVSEDRGVAP